MQAHFDFQARSRLLDFSDNLCILFGTLCSFCVGQSLFWIIVGSKQFENVVKDKVNILKLFFDNSSNKSMKIKFCESLKSRVSDESKSNIIQVEKENVNMLKKKFKGFFLFTFSIFIILLLITIYKYKVRFNLLDSATRDKEFAKFKGFLLGLFFVLFSFSTEIFIFLYIIQPYTIIGDIEILYEFLNIK